MLVIPTNDPFAALSPAVKYGSSLVVTPSFFPSSTTRGPKEKLFPNEESEEVFEDSDDELLAKTRVSDSDEASDENQKVDAMGKCLYLVLCLLFLLLLSSLCTFLYLLRMLSLICSYRYA